MASKIHPAHKEILTQLKDIGGKAEKDSFLGGYLGNSHPRYAVTTPEMRSIIKAWASSNAALGADEFCAVVSSLVSGASFNEKCMGGLLLGYAKPAQRKFDIGVFDQWLEQLEGWAETDALCTGKFQQLEIPPNLAKWKPLLKNLSKSDNIVKRRASLVLLCSPIGHSDDDTLARVALENIDRLKGEKDILITKAISWLLRTMIRHHRDRVVTYVDENRANLPAIAVRETLVKLDTGRKSTRIRSVS